MKQKRGPLLSSIRGAPGDEARVPLHRQVYARVRSSILEGAFAPGARLPSARTLAADLGMSRITVESAFTQLRAEGYLVRRVGAGSFVSDELPDVVRPVQRAPSRTAGAARSRARGDAALSARGRAITLTAPAPEPVGTPTFQPCMPALDVFPQATWARALARRARHERALLAYGEAAGYEPLRRAVATYLNAARGVRCGWEQVVVLSGAQQGIELVSRLLIDPGDQVWHEEPGYRGARGAFLAAGAEIVPVRVDADGLDVEAGIAAAPEARVVYVTPSHQFPLGSTMSLARRLALLAWADRADGWIIEDDYDSEFTYAGRPLAAVQGLDRSERVLYIGTFNKVMFPSLRLAYMVVPRDLVDAVIAARALSDGHPPVLAQSALADFMDEGHFGTHVRQMRALYEERRDVMLGALEAHVGPILQLGPTGAGMHVAARIRGGGDDRAIVAEAHALGLGVDCLSRHYMRSRGGRGLLLGFTGSPAEELERGARVLARLLKARRT